MNEITGLVRVLLADERRLVRAGMRLILESTPDLRVVGETDNGWEAQRLTAALSPHVLLYELGIPGPPPVAAVAWLRVHCPQTAVLALTATQSDAYLAAMVKAGAAGVLLKHLPPEIALRAVRQAAQGETLFSQEQRARAQRWQEQVGHRWTSLTNRERQVLHLLTQGADNASIARTLGVSTKTVGFHITNAFAKLGVASRLEAVVWMQAHIPQGLQ